MEDPARQYWNTIGAVKEFTHPVDLSWLAEVRRDSPVLDYGCGSRRATGTTMNGNTAEALQMLVRNPGSPA
ncbi:MAG TPA: hypothetical protein VN408_26705 [Actinoplanes sp.]|nr:hypothetical protein [Actinoplanes sp.]